MSEPTAQTIMASTDCYAELLELQHALDTSLRLMLLLSDIKARNEEVFIDRIETLNEECLVTNTTIESISSELQLLKDRIANLLSVISNERIEMAQRTNRLKKTLQSVNQEKKKALEKKSRKETALKDELRTSKMQLQQNSQQLSLLRSLLQKQKKDDEASLSTIEPVLRVLWQLTSHATVTAEMVNISDQIIPFLCQIIQSRKEKVEEIEASIGIFVTTNEGITAILLANSQRVPVIDCLVSLLDKAAADSSSYTHLLLNVFNNLAARSNTAIVALDHKIIEPLVKTITMVQKQESREHASFILNALMKYESYSQRANKQIVRDLLNKCQFSNANEATKKLMREYSVSNIMNSNSPKSISHYSNAGYNRQNDAHAIQKTRKSVYSYFQEE